MLNKYKQLIEITKFEAPEGIINMEYYITEKPDCDKYINDDIKQYGIEIRKKSIESISNLSDETERSMCSNISPIRNTVINIIHILAKSSVTPTTFKYNLDDMCGIYF